MPATMTGEPLHDPSFPVQVWKQMLHKYFDEPEIMRGMEYGWDVSLTAPPAPKDAKWNLQGASLFQNDVQSYVDQELSFGSLVGPFQEGELPFKVFCSPVNTVAKKIRKLGVQSWTVHNLTGESTASLTLIFIEASPGSLPCQTPTPSYLSSNVHEPCIIFKTDFARWYRWFLLDPVASVFFAI